MRSEVTKNGTMSIIINLKQTRKNVEQALEHINKGELLKDQIRFQHIHTLHKIIYLQACRLSHYAGLGMLNKGNTLTAENIACSKPKVYLAKSCQVTSKTIQNHIRRLEKKELVKRINKDGKLLLIVNPMLLSISPNFEHILAVLWENFKSVNINSISTLDFNKGKTFPIYYPSGNINSIITTSVNKLTKESQSDNNSIQETFQETQKTTHNLSISQEKNEKENSPTTSPLSDRKPKLGGEQNTDLNRKRFIEKQVLLLWFWCMEHLYSDKKFMAESQQEYAIAYFTKSFEGKYGGDIYHHISALRTKLGKWKRFASKSSAIKRFTPLPSSFFNDKNKHGFNITESWLNQDKRKLEYNKKWKIARSVERKAVQILSGYYPEKKTNPITKRKETYYRELNASEKIRELQRLEYSISRLSEKFPNIGKWYAGRLQEIIQLVETKQVA